MKKKDVESIGVRLSRSLRARRIESGHTQASLAEAAGVTVETVARIERIVRCRTSANLNPTLGTLEALARALGLDAAELLGAPPEIHPRRPVFELALAGSGEKTRARALAIVRAVVAVDRKGGR